MQSRDRNTMGNTPNESQAEGRRGCSNLHSSQNANRQTWWSHQRERATRVACASERISKTPGFRGRMVLMRASRYVMNRQPSRARSLLGTARFRASANSSLTRTTFSHEVEETKSESVFVHVEILKLVSLAHVFSHISKKL